MQKVTFYFDDSGVLHRNSPSGYFVYAGYFFTDTETLNVAKRKYINANKKIARSIKADYELKACRLAPKHRRSLYNAVKDYDSVGVVVDIKRVYDCILESKKAICRYKDYILKRCVKTTLKHLISGQRISPSEDITISLYIDQQLTATNGYYDLRDSIREELKYGVVNFNYNTTHAHLFSAEVNVEIQYCDSQKNYMIQACDILANRIWNSYATNNAELRKIPNNYILTMP